MEYIYDTVGICSKSISFELNDNIVTNIKFKYGCPGNLQAISKLLDGATVEYIYEKLSGNDCAGKGTSCADQLARAVKDAYDKSRN